MHVVCGSISTAQVSSSCLTSVRTGELVKTYYCIPVHGPYRPWYVSNYSVGNAIVISVNHICLITVCVGTSRDGAMHSLTGTSFLLMWHKFSTFCHSSANITTPPSRSCSVLRSTLSLYPGYPSYVNLSIESILRMPWPAGLSNLEGSQRHCADSLY